MTAVETFEEMVSLFFGNTHTIVNDTYRQFIDWCRMGSHFQQYMTTFGSVFDGIRKQVVDHLVDA